MQTNNTNAVAGSETDVLRQPPTMAKQYIHERIHWGKVKSEESRI